MVPVVVQLLREEDTTCSMPKTFGEAMETVDSVPGILQMLQVTSRLGSSQMGLGLPKPQTHEVILSLPHTPPPDSSMIQISKHVEPISYNTCRQRPKLIAV